MKNRIILAVAPTGGWGKRYNNPVKPTSIAEDVVNCVKAGASIVHLHSRDKQGELTTDLSSFSQAVSTIKKKCDVILEASTGGLSDLSAAERVLPASNTNAEMGSLNIGSLNFGNHVYQNKLTDVRFWIETMTKYRVKPSLEIFDTGHMETALSLINEGLITLPCNFSLIFDVKWGMPFHPALLEYLKSRIPEKCRWTALLINSTDFLNHLVAAHAGASVLRVGFEDSFAYNGKTALSNAELVKALRVELEQNGFSIATADEARAILL
ncbi:MAG: 3-keto-5-aminohexanoate cleavage protein [Desulfobacterales bacterium]|nr:3-keto-5-aminohexanoate cleavage protein [Desulfobacterales bacterium]